MEKEQAFSEVEIHPPAPHSRKQELIMRGFLFPEVDEIFVACGVKFGKSIGAATCIVNAAMLKRSAKWRWLAPIYRQSRLGMEYFSKIIPPPPHSEIIDSKMVIKLPKLDSTIEFWHTSKPVDLEGAGVHGQIGDEAAKMHYDAYISAKTTTTFTKGPSMWISTPYGKNWFYKKYQEAEDQMKWAIKKGVTPTRLAIHAPSTANPKIMQAVIDQARKDLPDRLFRQYYLAEFIDNGSIFIGVRECVRGPLLDIDKDEAFQSWFSTDSLEKEVVIGVDWAKHKDYTVFIAIDFQAQPKKVVGFLRFHGIGYVEAAKELYKFSKKFKEVGTIWHDKTGVGEALDDILGHFPMHFHGFTFSNSSKSSVVNSLGLTFEQKDIQIPNWPTMLSELDSFEVEVSELGTMRYNAAAGAHDDIVMALTLANACAGEYTGNSEVGFLDDLAQVKTLGPLERYYKDLISDEDDSPFN